MYEKYWMKGEITMRLFEKVKLRIKIHRMCVLMRERMNEQDMHESIWKIKHSLRLLPHARKEGLIDTCLKVLQNEKQC